MIRDIILIYETFEWDGAGLIYFILLIHLVLRNLHKINIDQVQHNIASLEFSYLPIIRGTI